ncbi:hypothetical protein GQF01_33910 [Paenibacillus sp. 5J-6]|uniref:Uncharacterized protein n=1 Tax=Paenibacillus silvestris TaxID=2606219 RepID=A0A6L8VBR1_9BACL|nr:hypothetical protein [Paenibacillus silvestris]MZQ87121.1 hypothetical protein [Paenibacillus silvestris]
MTRQAFLVVAADTCGFHRFRSAIETIKTFAYDYNNHKRNEVFPSAQSQYFSRTVYSSGFVFINRGNGSFICNGTTYDLHPGKVLYGGEHNKKMFVVDTEILGPLAMGQFKGLGYMSSLFQPK